MRVAEPAGGKRAHDIEQADHRQHPAADLHRQAAIDQIGRQMRGDEGELESAGEEAQHQQHIGPVTEGFAQRLPQRLRSVGDGCMPDGFSEGRVASASENGSTSKTAAANTNSAKAQP